MRKLNKANIAYHAVGVGITFGVMMAGLGLLYLIGWTIFN